MLVIRDAKFIEDVLDGGIRTQVKDEDVVDIKEYKNTGQDIPSVPIQSKKHHARQRYGAWK